MAETRNVAMKKCNSAAAGGKNVSASFRELLSGSRADPEPAVSRRHSEKAVLSVAPGRFLPCAAPMAMAPTWLRFLHGNYRHADRRREKQVHADLYHLSWSSTDKSFF